MTTIEIQPTTARANEVLAALCQEIGMGSVNYNAAYIEFCPDQKPSLVAAMTAAGYAEVRDDTSVHTTLQRGCHVFRVSPMGVLSVMRLGTVDLMKVSARLSEIFDTEIEFSGLRFPHAVRCLHEKARGCRVSFPHEGRALMIVGTSYSADHDSGAVIKVMEHC